MATERNAGKRYLHRLRQGIRERGEDTFQRLFDRMLNGVAHCRMIFDGDRPVDFVYLKVNEAFAAQTGLKDVVGKRASVAIPGIQAADPELFERYGRVARTGVPDRFERYVAALGDWYDLSVYSPRTLEFVAVFEVITQRKREQQLLETIIGGSADAIYAKDAQGRYLLLNDPACRNLGKAREELLGQDVFGVLPQESALQIHARDQAVLEAGKVATYEEVITSTAGPRTMLSTRGPIRDFQQRIIGLFGVSRDITDRKRAEDVVRESKERLDQALQRSHTGAWEFDPVSQEAYRSAEHARIFGHEPNSPGWSLPAFLGQILPEDREAMRATIEQALAGACSFSQECRIRRADGAIRWIYVAGGPQNGPDGPSKRMAGIVQDITERKVAEQQRAALEGQLQHLQRLESVGRLAGGIAHDMNNVLAAIMAVAETLPAGPADLARKTELVFQACLRGRKLVKGLLDFSRKEVREAESFDLNALVRGEAELLASTTLNRVRIDLDLAAELPALVGSPTALANALMNLCVNALDAMPDGGTLALRTRLGDKGLLELVVEDSGQGMTPEVLSRAIEPFYTTKEFGKGTGLGLSIVFGTVQAHGGTLDITSSPGAGTRVCLRLPVAAGAEPEPANRVHASVPPRSGAVRTLLVDDDPLTREASTAFWECLGYRVTAAATGEEAIARMAAGEVYDLVLMDQNMPGMSGLEALRAIRAGRPAIPALLVTGFVDAALVRALDQLGNTGLLAKPYTAEELQKALDGLVLPDPSLGPGAGWPGPAPTAAASMAFPAGGGPSVPLG